MTDEHEHEHHEHDHEHSTRPRPRHEHELDYAGHGRGVPRRQGRRLPLRARQPDPAEAERDDVHRASPTSRSTRRSGSRDWRSSRTPATSRPLPDPDLGRAAAAGASRRVFAFELGGEPRQLTAYVIDGGDGDSLFVPFLDATSGNETYGAGRYLDLEPEDDGTYVLDFNLAYHPSCVYAPTTRAR